MTSRAVWLAAIPTLLVGCVESLSLGSECAESRSTHCMEQAARPSPAPAGDGEARIPASTRELDAAARTRPEMLADAELGPAANVDAQPSAAPVLSAGGIGDYIANGAFDLNRGIGGQLGFEATESVAVGLNIAAPWSACRLGFNGVSSAYAVRGDADSQEVRSSDGSTFIEANIGADDFSGLAQPLKQPFLQGKRYSFAVDLRASAGDQVALELWGSLITCIPAIKLVETRRVNDGWQRVCIAFDAPVDVAELVIKPVGRAGSRAFFDNVRADPGCE